MIKIFFFITLFLQSVSVYAADNALGTYVFTYKIGTSPIFTDSFVLQGKDYDSAYFGEDEYGKAVTAIKQGSQICLWQVDSYIFAQTWCTPITKLTKNAFVSGTYATNYDGIDYTYATSIYKSSVSKTSSVAPISFAVRSLSISKGNDSAEDKLLSKIEAFKTDSRAMPPPLSGR
jgi:hypothetical protein